MVVESITFPMDTGFMYLHLKASRINNYDSLNDNYYLFKI